MQEQRALLVIGPDDGAAGGTAAAGIEKGIILISTHVDDCDAACSHPPDADKLREVANKLFSQGNQQGIKVVEDDVMLGVHRTTTIVQGVRRVKLDQAAIIEGLSLIHI